MQQPTCQQRGGDSRQGDGDILQALHLTDDLRRNERQATQRDVVHGREPEA